MDYVSTVCCLLACLLYYNTLDAGFVYDDRRAILNNPDLLEETPWTDLFFNDFWGTPINDNGSIGSYRPLSVLTFRLNNLIGGLKPWGFHFVNILLHSLATYLVIKMCRYVLPKNKTDVGSAVAGLLFASHPIHTEAVAGIVGRADLISCNLYLLSILAYFTHLKHRNQLCCPGYYNPSDYSFLKNDPKKYRKYHNIVIALQRNAANYSRHNFKEEPKFDECCWNNKVNSWTYLVLTIVFCGAAMLSKETGITALAICIVYDYITSTTSKEKQLRSLLVLCMALSTMLAFRLQFPTPTFSKADNPTAKDASLFVRFFTFAYLPVFNFWMMLLPITLSFDWGMEAIPRVTSIFDFRIIISIAFYSVLGFIGYTCMGAIMKEKRQSIKSEWYRNAQNIAKDRNDIDKPCPCLVCHHASTAKITRRHRYRLKNIELETTCVCPFRSKLISMKKRGLGANSSEVICFALALLVIPFIPATNLFFYVGFVVAERVLYTPSVGFCLLLGFVVASVWSVKRYRKMISVLTFMTVLAFCVRTVNRNRDWLNEEVLYRSAVHINPPKAYGNLGSILSSQGNVEEAEWAFRKALQYRPNMADVHYNLGILLQGKKHLDEAIESFRKAIYFRPTLAIAYVNLGSALIAAGRQKEAIKVLETGSHIDGTGLKDRREHEHAKISALLQLGALYLDQEDLQDALVTYQEAARSLPPNYPPQTVYTVLADTLARLDRAKEAEKWYEAAAKAKCKPHEEVGVPKPSASRRVTSATQTKIVAKNMSQTGDSERVLKKAKKVAPTDSSSYLKYGEYLVLKKRYQEAADMYEKAAELSPMDHPMAMTAAVAMRVANRLNESEKWYRKAVDLKPNDQQSHSNLGAILHLNGKFSEALQSYKEALRLDPTDETVLVNLHRLRGAMT